MTASLAQICENIQSRNSRFTDKNRGGHDFIGMYSQIFAPYRDRATSVFEIGVNRGGSTMMWRDYFKGANIYGLDINLRRAIIPKGESGRITLLCIDQSKKEDLEAFAKKCGPFDVGIDDGSHIWSHQILTFETLWPHIKPGGTFVIEDTCTSYAAWINTEGTNRVGVNYNDAPLSCVEYFKKLVDHLHFDGEDYNKIHEWSYFQQTIDWVSFRNNAIVIKKKA